MHKWIWFLAALLIVGFETPDARAQASGAHIDGIVHDAQGLPLPNVTVALTETQTGLARTVETTSEGAYQFVSLNPGQYQLSAVLTGFDSPVRTLTLEVNQYLRLDLVMQVGPLRQEFRVVGAPEVLRTADASLGEVIERTLTKELPLNGGHVLDLALLAPAAHAGFGAQMGNANPLYWRPNQNSALSVGGGRPNAGTTLGENPIRANYTGQPVFTSGTRNSNEWFNTNAFVAPPAYTFGNLGRNTVTGPAMHIADIAFSREFRLLESLHMQIRAEGFNAFNETNYGTPNRFVNEPQFGTITMAMHPGREAQFSARLTF